MVRKILKQIRVAEACYRGILFLGFDKGDQYTRIAYFFSLLMLFPVFDANAQICVPVNLKRIMTSIRIFL